MREHEKSDQMLDDLFGVARETPLEATPAFMARVLADADGVQAGFEQGLAPTRSGFSLAAAWRTLGGWPVVSGLVTATAVGVWLGFSPMTAVSDTVAGYMFGTSGLGSLDADYAWLDTFGDA